MSVANCAKYIPRPKIYWIIQGQSPHAICFDFEQCSCFCAVYTLKLRYVCYKLCKLHSASVDLLYNSNAIAPCYWFWSSGQCSCFRVFLYSEIAICLTQTVQNTFRVRRCTGQFTGNRPLLFVLISGNAYVFVCFYTLKLRYLCCTNCAKYIPRPYMYWIIHGQSPLVIGFDLEQCSCFCAVFILWNCDIFVCKLGKIHSASVDLLDNSRAIAPCYLFWIRAMLMFLCVFILWNLDIFVKNCA